MGRSRSRTSEEAKMNILILNDDGPKSWGLRILREAAKRHWKQARIVTLVPARDVSGASMSIAPAWRKAKGKKVEDGDPLFLQFPTVTPLGLLVHAFQEQRQYLQHGTWDLVMSGVNLGANVGLNVVMSGTTAPAIMAAKMFGVPAWAFSQATGPAGTPVPKLKGDEERRAFRNAAKLFPGFLATNRPWPGKCLNVNFPAGPAKAPINVPVAAYDPYLGPDHVPAVERKAPADVEYLDDGYMTISELFLEVNPPQK
jgi:5'-nucleotidase